MKFTEEEMQLLHRHYTKIKIFGKVFLWWDTSPRAVLKHLQELKVKNIVQPDIVKSVCDLDGKTIPVTFKVTKMKPSKLSDEDKL